MRISVILAVLFTTAHPALADTLYSPPHYAMSSNGIVLDAEGHPHAFYGARTLRHSWWDGEAWQEEVIDNNGATGDWAVATVDQTGAFHVFYLRSALHVQRYAGACKDPGTFCEFADAFYATNRSGTWTLQDIGTAGLIAGEHTQEGHFANWHESNGHAAFIDSKGRPSLVSFFPGTQSIPMGYLARSFLDETGWQFEIIDDGAANLGSLQQMKAVSDPTGITQILYSHLDKNVFDSRLKIAREDTGGWKLETVLTNDMGEGFDYGHKALAIDSTGVRHVALSMRVEHFTPFALYYLTDVSGVWEAEALYSEVGAISGIMPSIHVSDDLDINMLHYRVGGDSGADTMPLLTSRTSGTWTTTPLGGEGISEIMLSRREPTFVAEGGESLHLIHLDPQSRAVVHDIYNETLEKRSTVASRIAPSGPREAGRNVTSESGLDGSTHVIFEVEQVVGTHAVYASDATGVWETQDLHNLVSDGSDPVGFDLFVDPFGIAHFVLITSSRFLYYGNNQGGTWHAELATEGAIRSGRHVRPDIKITSDGSPQIAYFAQGNVLTRLRKSGGSWSEDSIVSGPALSSGVFASEMRELDDGHVQIIATFAIALDRSNELKLILATETKDGWRSEEVYDGRTVERRHHGLEGESRLGAMYTSQPSLAFDVDGSWLFADTPAFCYGKVCLGGGTEVIRANGDGLEFRHIDSDTYYGPWYRGQRSNAELHVAPNGDKYVSYWDEEHQNLNVVTFENGRWSSRRVPDAEIGAGYHSDVTTNGLGEYTVTYFHLGEQDVQVLTGSRKGASSGAGIDGHPTADATRATSEDDTDDGGSGSSGGGTTGGAAGGSSAEGGGGGYSGLPILLLLVGAVACRYRMEDDKSVIHH